MFGDEFSHAQPSAQHHVRYEGKSNTANFFSPTAHSSNAPARAYGEGDSSPSTMPPMEMPSIGMRREQVQRGYDRSFNMHVQSQGWRDRDPDADNDEDNQYLVQSNCFSFFFCFFFVFLINFL
jgi:hypothetical protein